MKKAKSTGSGKYGTLLAVCSKLSPVAAAVAYPCANMRLAHARRTCSGKSS